MRAHIAAMGKFYHPLIDREEHRLQVITIAELFAPHNRRPDLPMARTDGQVSGGKAVRIGGLIWISKTLSVIEPFRADAVVDFLRTVSYIRHQ